MKKLLCNLLAAFEHTIVAADNETILEKKDIENVEVEDLVFDSREVKKNSLYFALPGTHIHGNEFIPQAIDNGASVIVFEGTFSEDLKMRIAKSIAKRELENTMNGNNQNNLLNLAFIRVPQARFSMSPISACFYDYPCKKLAIIGVTGTEGKSSTVSFIWQLLRLTGKKAGFISTVEYSFGGDALPNPQHQTTPEAPIIHHHLKEMVDNGCEYAVVESSSHGLSKKLNRLGDVLFDCGVFMNVTLEHLEFHKNFETYRDDKANLFRALDSHDHVKTLSGKEVQIPSIGIVNLEDPSYLYFTKATTKNVYGFTTLGKAGKAAAETGIDALPLPEIKKGMRYMVAKNIAAARFGLDFTCETDGLDASYPEHFDSVLPRKYKKIKVKSMVPGAFNAYNIMASMIAVSSVTKTSFEEIAKYTKDLTPIKGRMTVIEKGQPFELVVDYAHTPSSFETIFPPLKKRCSGKIFAVFGSGGERDLTKRPLQGEIAASFCDSIILADEDPRGEDPVELLKGIAVGAEKKGKVMGQNLFITPDRKKAIRQVFNMAHKGDIVLLLGKSHENSIIYKDHVMPYDEIQEANLALSEMGYNQTV